MPTKILLPEEKITITGKSIVTALPEITPLPTKAPTVKVNTENIPLPSLLADKLITPKKTKASTTINIADTSLERKANPIMSGGGGGGGGASAPEEETAEEATDQETSPYNKKNLMILLVASGLGFYFLYKHKN